ncbi:U-box domain-containing protein 32 isoform X1 [Punica granatum]|uniref:RING-type E3 ubiquitin transferase n=1 Tax=Punica granatum TaxID=22663 RepID=A0A6P8DHJ4_PUNGR|nr:U-box domain-containing protein 32 isoform X1 [Punica granatum]XP_031392771.1 U-box domain-containing protein 32 isoform X1 [Punica granatum]
MGGAADETIFVAVGKSVESSKTTLLWALDNFVGKKICLLHVHRPAHSAAFTDGKFVIYKPKENGVKVSQQDVEMQKINEIFNHYQSFLAEAGVEADKIWIERDDVGKGIVESISSHNIRWLVMGAAANKYYSKNLSTLKSRKAIFVCQNAPEFSHIWFTCNGRLIYTRELRNDSKANEETNTDLRNNEKLEGETIPSLLSVTSLHSETRQLECSMSEPVPQTFEQAYLPIQRSRSEDLDYSFRSFNPLILPQTIEGRSLIQHSAESGKSKLQGRLRSLKSQGSEDATSTSKLRSVSDQEEGTQGLEVHDVHYRLEEALIEVKNSRKKEFEEAIKRWKEEENALDAKQNAKSLEISYAKESNERKELEKELKRKKEELEAVQNQHSGIIKHLHAVQEQNSALENQISKSRSVEGELEEKIVSAVELLIAFKERRDRLRIEHGEAMREVRVLRKSVRMESPSFCGPLILSFTFEEIIQATHSFDQSCKIREGRYGTMYKGTLRHADVAIKMLPFSGSRGALDFQDEVEVLSRVRHPNLVTLIGTCPESYSLVYEYMKNGSLEDRLTCRGKKSPPFLWQTRMLIAAEICSTLIFLHSHEPSIIHGNLKPSNILLDSNFVSKISDLGISRLARKEDPHPHLSSVYKDPEYHATGVLTRESDVYSFGVILLRLITGRSISSVVKDVRCALEMGNFNTVLDVSAGDWPLDEVEQLARVSARCCESNKLDRPDLVSEIWTVLELMRDLAITSASKLHLEESRQAPSHFVCPIYQEVMKDPLIAADGHTYEAEAIRGWLDSGHNTSPMTNLKLEHTDLVPNYALLYAIQEWRQLL